MIKAFIVAVVVGASILFSSRGECQSRPQQAKQHGANNGWTVSRTSYETPESIEKIDSTEKQSPNGNEYSQWALVFVGLVTFLVVGWQAWESRRGVEISQKTMVSQFRPRLAIRNIRLDDVDRPSDVIVTLVNNGGTAGRIVGGTVGIQSVNEWEIGKPEWISKGSILRNELIHAGEERSLEKISLNDNLAWAVASKSASEGHYSTAIVCCGDISYRDDNEIVRKMAFYRIFDWPSKRFIPSTDPEKDYSD